MTTNIDTSNIDTLKSDSEKLAWEKPDMLIVDAVKVTQGGTGDDDESFSTFNSS